MGLFSRKTEQKPEELKAACACGNECSISDIEKARIIVLGACCKKSADTYANVCQAVAELELDEQVLNIGDAAQIAQYGVMQTPALVVDSKVLSYGRLITVAQAKELIQKAAVS